MKVLPQKNKHYLLLGAIVFLTIGLLAGIFLFQSNKISNKVAFSPTPTVVPTPLEYRKIPPVENDTITSWQTFTDKKLKYTIKHPKNIILDKRQTSEGRINAFIFEEDKTATLPGKVTVLYLADTGKSGIDGFTAFSRGDCGANCDVSHSKSDWITLNNVYGIKNPLPEDVHNYYLTDKKQSGDVLNAYVGGYTDMNDNKAKGKIEVFEEMIKTIQFER